MEVVSNGRVEERTEEEKIKQITIKKIKKKGQEEIN